MDAYIDPTSTNWAEESRWEIKQAERAKEIAEEIKANGNVCSLCGCKVGSNYEITHANKCYKLKGIFS